MFLLFFTKDSIEIKNIEFLINDVFLDIFVASSEEILFTYALIMYLETKNLSFFKIIIFSALIFALSHLLNITLDNIFNTLLQCLYCFGIGLITSFMFVSTRNIILSILFHFLFNFFNQSLFEKFIISIPVPIFILVNCIIALLTFIYWLILYKKRTIL